MCCSMKVARRPHLSYSPQLSGAHTAASSDRVGSQDHGSRERVGLFPAEKNTILKVSIKNIGEAHLRGARFCRRLLISSLHAQVRKTSSAAP